MSLAKCFPAERFASPGAHVHEWRLVALVAMGLVLASWCYWNGIDAVALAFGVVFLIELANLVRAVAFHRRLMTKGWRVTFRQSLLLFAALAGSRSKIPDRADSAVLPMFDPHREDWENLLEVVAKTDLWMEAR